MDTFPRRLATFTVVVALAMALSACTSATPSHTGAADSVRLATSNSAQLSGMEALLEGTLKIDANGCVIAETEGGPVALVWPKGYSVTGDAKFFDVLDTDNNVVASSGENVSLGGGGGSASSAKTEPDCSTGTPWIVGTITRS